MKKEQTERKIHIAQDDDTEKLREWWKRNGVGIIAGIILIALGVLFLTSKSSSGRRRSGGGSSCGTGGGCSGCGGGCGGGE